MLSDVGGVDFLKCVPIPVLFFIIFVNFNKLFVYLFYLLINISDSFLAFFNLIKNFKYEGLEDQSSPKYLDLTFG